jgi:hypothetical protein
MTLIDREKILLITEVASALILGFLGLASLYEFPIVAIPSLAIAFAIGLRANHWRSQIY